MAKTWSQYVCQQCGRVTPRLMGRCPQCGAWNSMLEEAIRPRKGVSPRTGGRGSDGPMRLGDIEGCADDRLRVPLDEVARVLGGGLVAGSIVLIGGEPGIGKSTLLLQLGMAMAQQHAVLYVSGEESLSQIKARALRLSGGAGLGGEFMVLSETDVGAIVEHIGKSRPQVVVVDSIQTMHMPEVEASIGSLSQVREAATQFQALSKRSGTAVFLVGHVTKEGAIAGPKVLEHIVDTVLYLEGDPYHAYRLLRCVKNRFGATTEVGVFEMTGAGLAEVPNPSQAFIAERARNVPGSAIAVTMEGTRPLMVEVQGLTSPTSFGHPRRTANGVDYNRLLLTVAVLSRRVGLSLAEQDVFVNVVGGLRIEEPASDLAVAAAIASSVRDRALPPDVVLIGEVGLSGELRAVGQLPARLREAVKMGFRKAIVPPGKRGADDQPDGIELLPVKTVAEALGKLFASG
jgi:DNA repair protein RadA/Sms